MSGTTVLLLVLFFGLGAVIGLWSEYSAQRRLADMARKVQERR